MGYGVQTRDTPLLTLVSSAIRFFVKKILTRVYVTEKKKVIKNSK
jgi:hypothetical protein